MQVLAAAREARLRAAEIQAAAKLVIQNAVPDKFSGIKFEAGRTKVAPYAPPPSLSLFRTLLVLEICLSSYDVGGEAIFVNMMHNLHTNSQMKVLVLGCQIGTDDGIFFTDTYLHSCAVLGKELDFCSF